MKQSDYIPEMIYAKPYAVEIHLCSPCTPGNLVVFCLSYPEGEQALEQFLEENRERFQLLEWSMDTGMSDRICDLVFDAEGAKEDREKAVEEIRSFLIRWFSREEETVTEEQLEAWLEEQDAEDLCPFCICRDRCHGMTSSPKGPVYPYCSDRDWGELLNMEQVKARILEEREEEREEHELWQIRN